MCEADGSGGLEKQEEGLGWLWCGEYLYVSFCWLGHVLVSLSTSSDGSVQCSRSLTWTDETKRTMDSGGMRRQRASSTVQGIRAGKHVLFSDDATWFLNKFIVSRAVWQRCKCVFGKQRCRQRTSLPGPLKEKECVVPENGIFYYLPYGNRYSYLQPLYHIAAGTRCLEVVMVPG